MIRAMNSILVCLLAGTAGLVCADYGSHDDPECQGVSCTSPPAAVCIDSRTVRVHESPGTCSQGVCSYEQDEIPCAEGQCENGECVGCSPDCTNRECGPDPRCAQSCGDCLGCEGEIDPGLCTADGTCMRVCCPFCGDRECGPDGCGGACGFCDEGCSCNAEGRCECGCEYPNYPYDCSLVSYFQCGFDAHCENGEIHVSWHEHVMCNGMEDIVEFECTYVCPHGCTEGPILDWPENGEQLVAGHCLGGDRCEGVLIDNAGPPGIYPILYNEPADGAEQFLLEKGAFLARYGVGEGDYTVEPHLVTYSPEVGRRATGDAWIPVADGEIDEDTLVDVARGFLEESASFFGIDEALLAVRSSSCSGSTCRVNFDQDYCGLGVASDDPAWEGRINFVARPEGAGLQRADSTIVPVIPMPRNPYLTEDEAALSLVGMVLEYWCADGLHTVEVTSQSTFDFGEGPLVYVTMAPTGIAALWYRLAYRIVLTVESFLTWTVFVDVFDGSLLATRPEFICD